VFGSSDVLVAQWEREFPTGIDIDAFTLTIRLRRLDVNENIRDP